VAKDDSPSFRRAQLRKAYYNVQLDKLLWKNPVALNLLYIEVGPAPPPPPQPLHPHAVKRATLGIALIVRPNPLPGLLSRPSRKLRTGTSHRPRTCRRNWKSCAANGTGSLRWATRRDGGFHAGDHVSRAGHARFPERASSSWHNGSRGTATSALARPPATGPKRTRPPSSPSGIQATVPPPWSSPTRYRSHLSSRAGRRGRLVIGEVVWPDRGKEGTLPGATHAVLAHLHGGRRGGDGV
jgi:hypothetical protein